MARPARLAVRDFAADRQTTTASAAEKAAVEGGEMNLTLAELAVLSTARLEARLQRKALNRRRYERRMCKIYPRWGQGTNCHGLI